MFNTKRKQAKGISCHINLRHVISIVTKLREYFIFLCISVWLLQIQESLHEKTFKVF